MRKFLLIPICILGFLLAFPVLAQEKINDFRVHININQDGTIKVTETIQYDFGTNNRHGVYRDIPLKFKVNGKDQRIKIYDIEVTDENGNHLTIKVSGLNRNKRVKIGDADILITGEHTYIISYYVSGAVGFFDNKAELYWNITGNEWQAPIGNTHAEIYLHDEFEEKQVSIKCFSGETSSTVSCHKKEYIYGDTYVIGAIFEEYGLGSYEGLTIRMDFPKGVLTEPEFNFWWFLMDNLYVLIPIIIFIILFYVWNRWGRDPRGRGTVVVQYDTPDDLSPGQVGVIYDETAENKDITAEIITLAIKGYLKITKIKKEGLFASDDYLLEKLKNPDEYLNSHQRKLLDKLFTKKNIEKSLKEINVILDGLKDKNSFIYKMYKNVLKIAKSNLVNTKDPEQDNKNVVKLSSLKYKFAKDLSKLQSDLYEDLVKQKYFVRNPQTLKGIFIGFGIFFGWFGVIGLGNQYGLYGVISAIVSVILVIFFGYLMSKMTPKGVLAKEHIEGLKLYLEVAEKDRIEFHNNPKNDPKTFEKLLPYAIVLGVEKKWAKQFEDIYTIEPDWYSGGRAGSFSSVNFTNSLGSFSSHANSALGATRSSGGSGGSSGGGGGGGGGGSW